MHEEETGQVFHREVKEKICAITASQPGLVNGIAYQRVERNPGKELIDYTDYLVVEDWFLTEAIDKNISNVINKAKQHRAFVEKLLFTDEKLKYKINDEKIKFLHAHGLIRKDSDGFVVSARKMKKAGRNKSRKLPWSIVLNLLSRLYSRWWKGKVTGNATPAMDKAI